MNPLQLEITKLIGKKELSLGCWLFIQNPDWYAQFIEESDVWNWFTIMSASDWYSILNDKKDNIKDWYIIWHPATLTDFHRWMNEKYKYWFKQIHTGKENYIVLHKRDSSTIFMDGSHCVVIPYDSSKELLEQSSETLTQIISLIKSYAKEMNAA